MILSPVSDGHGRSDARVPLLHKLHRGLIHLLDLPLEHLVSDKQIIFYTG